MNFWKRVLWTDESRFSLDFNDGRLRVRRLPTERFLDVCIAEHDRYGSGSIMIWGGITFDGRTEAVQIVGNLTGQRYVDEIITPVIIPFVQENGLVLQQDNARPHTSSVAKNALADNNVEFLQWPARSPDLSPIEHIWDVIQRKLNIDYPPSVNLDQLAQRVQTAWNEIEQSSIQHLIKSVPKRLEECMQRSGGHTHY